MAGYKKNQKYTWKISFGNYADCVWVSTAKKAFEVKAELEEFFKKDLPMIVIEVK